MQTLPDIHFNYIITIHNKETLIEDVILHVLRCMKGNSTLYPVLDGCTDGTEKIVDRIIDQNRDKRIHKVYTDDVHELRSINAALNIASHDGEGFNIILQDDVILKDEKLEEHVLQLYSWGGSKLGLVSFRLGANFSRLLLKSRKHKFTPLYNYIENIVGHNAHYNYPINIGDFAYREVGIKSPICIPFYVVRNVGIPDEVYAPWEDIDYCYRILMKGYHNGVYALEYQSDVKWGTMRTQKQKLAHDTIIEKNVRLFKQRHADSLKHFPKDNLYNSGTVTIFSHNNRTTVSLATKVFVRLKEKFTGLKMLVKSL